MNEEAIKAAYNLFVRTGYQDTIDDFKSLISTNEDARKTAYDLFKRTGYADSFDDFNSLMGVGGVASAPVQPLKKKRGTQTSTLGSKASSKRSTSRAFFSFVPKTKATRTIPLIGIYIWGAFIGISKTTR